MITSLQQESFKCFSSLDLPLAPLTLFTGLNAAGKSSSLQTLLLLAQTVRGHHETAELKLNGPMAHLGIPTDVINIKIGGARLALGFTTDLYTALWRFAVTGEDKRVLSTTSLEWSAAATTTLFEGEQLRGMWPEAEPLLPAREVLEKLTFLGAARQVDTDVFPIPDMALHPIGDVGRIGEFAPWWLHKEAETRVSAERCHEKTETNVTLRFQVDEWMSDLFESVNVNAVLVPRTNLVRLEFKTGLTSDWSRPANVGFGVSYALPIIIAGLCSPAGSVLIIDSPEAHLHPRAQARIGAFLAQVAASGVQVLVETHSDHVMDGVRIAVRKVAWFHNQPHSTTSGRKTTRLLLALLSLIAKDV